MLEAGKDVTRPKEHTDAHTQSSTKATESFVLKMKGGLTASRSVVSVYLGADSRTDHAKPRTPPAKAKPTTRAGPMTEGQVFSVNEAERMAEGSE